MFNLWVARLGCSVKRLSLIYLANAETDEEQLADCYRMDAISQAFLGRLALIAAKNYISEIIYGFFEGWLRPIAEILFSHYGFDIGEHGKYKAQEEK